MRTQIRSLLPVATLLFLGACGGDDDGGPTGPDPADLEIQAFSGDGQFGRPGETLDQPFRARVRDTRNDDPEEGVTVAWRVVSGEGATLASSTSVTGADGMASNTLTLGPQGGVYQVEASFEGLTGSPASFQARAVVAPIVDGFPDEPVAAGSAIELTGSGFSSDADENVVLFSGIRGGVTAAADDRLTVTVPPCLPGRAVEVSVGFGNVRSAPVSVEVVAQGEPLDLGLGDSRILSDPRGLACERLPAGTRWLAVAHSVAPEAGAPFPFHLAGVRDPASAAGMIRGRMGAEVSGEGEVGSSRPRGPGAQDAWEGRVRALERTLGPPRPGDRRSAEAAARHVAQVPEVGDRREFNVLNADLDFENITAEVVHVGARAVIYEDLDAPEGGLESSDFRLFSEEFDGFIEPAVTEVYGEASDLDGNDRVVILFTPVVNSLTEEGSDGFVGGFFFGLDLLPEREGSNGGEIFYTLVADPEGDFGDPRGREVIRTVVPAVLAHEFQHMVNFNQRALVRNGSFADELWLSEAVAVMAEDIVGEAFREAGNEQRARVYTAGNWVRAQRYLRDPEAATLVAVEGQGSLAERGAGWLFLRWLRGQEGGNQILSEITKTTRTGVSNVTAATGESWATLVTGWAGALWLDEVVATDTRFQFPDLALRETLDEVGDGYNLSPVTLGASDVRRMGTVEASSGAYFLLGSAVHGLSRELAVSLAGEGGGTATVGDLRLLLVRTR